MVVMVLIEINQGLVEFLHETSVKTSVEDVTKELCDLHNLVGMMDRLAYGLLLLSKHGPMKHPDKIGLSPEQLSAGGNEELLKQNCPHADPTGIREGIPPGPEAIQHLEICAQACLSVVSKDLAKRRVALSMEKIQEALQNARGAVMIAYPMKLPDWDVVRLMLAGEEDLAGHDAVKYVYKPDSALWFAGKKMEHANPLSKYVGNNEKVKIKIKICHKGQNAPQREAAIDDETKQKMMSHWHKKKEEEAKLLSAEEDSYLNSAWANPAAFKQNSHGLGNIQYRGGMR